MPNLEEADIERDEEDMEVLEEAAEFPPPGSYAPDVMALHNMLANDDMPIFAVYKKLSIVSQFCHAPLPCSGTPLQIWDKKVRNGHIKTITDDDIRSVVLEMKGTNVFTVKKNVSTTYITCPADPNKRLGIKLPFLVMTIKNLKKYFSVEVQVLDDKNHRRRFRLTTFQHTKTVNIFACAMPLELKDRWNKVLLDLPEYTCRAYGTNYVETLRVQINVNCRIRRVYFSDQLYSEDETPAEFKLCPPPHPDQEMIARQNLFL
ncbi:cilia- and flagella-associated protein 20-like [Rana temporaria]|uniref:cilia- and flagella-associated protein 20-like n=1 Tax=Rana temporaria TaxID=8407 RepID=UPI001AAC9075|nr:cilia- and flagella-associated protein 20-like [Rana temporaria]